MITCLHNDSWKEIVPLIGKTKHKIPHQKCRPVVEQKIKYQQTLFQTPRLKCVTLDMLTKHAKDEEVFVFFGNFLGQISTNYNICIQQAIVQFSLSPLLEKSSDWTKLRYGTEPDGPYHFFQRIWALVV